ncbi:MAG: response regulator transcription factor [Bacteroidales bacterium]|nr:response regulator transcription factor [Bacteroidales bacterium]
MKKTVLLADHDHEFANILAGILQNFGYEVFAADNKIDARRFCSTSSLDLLLIDEQFPNTDVLRTIRAIHARNKRLPIIVLTSNPTKDDVVFAFKSGFSDFICKHSSPAEMIVRIQRCFSTLAPDKEKFLLGTSIFIPQDTQIISSDHLVTFLTQQENKLLHLLCPPGKIAKTENLKESIWDSEGDWDNNLHVLLRNLRRRLSNYHVKIVNKRGIGYRLHFDDRT